MLSLSLVSIVSGAHNHIIKSEVYFRINWPWLSQCIEQCKMRDAHFPNYKLKLFIRLVWIGCTPWVVSVRVCVWFPPCLRAWFLAPSTFLYQQMRWTTRTFYKYVITRYYGSRSGEPNSMKAPFNRHTYDPNGNTRSRNYILERETSKLSSLFTNSFM